MELGKALQAKITAKEKICDENLCVSWFIDECPWKTKHDVDNIHHTISSLILVRCAKHALN